MDDKTKNYLVNTGLFILPAVLMASATYAALDYFQPQLQQLFVSSAQVEDEILLANLDYEQVRDDHAVLPSSDLMAYDVLLAEGEEAHDSDCICCCG